MPTNYWLKFGNSMAVFNGSGAQFTHVEQPGSLTVSLVGTGTGFDTTKSFNVVVTFGSAISYSVDGVPVQSPSATCTLTLKAGESSVISNIPFGTTYVVSETVSDEGYELSSITNASGTMTDAGQLASVVTNVYHAPGTLIVGVSLSGVDYDPTKSFAFTVTFGRAISYSVNGTPVGSPTNTYSGSLAAGGSVVLGNIPSGVSYSVTESALSQQDRDDGYSTGSVTNGSGTMTDAGSITATANYTYTEPAYSDVIYLWNMYSSGTTTFYVKLSSSVVYKVNGVKQAAASEFTVDVPAGSASKAAIEVRYKGGSSWMLQAATIGMPPVTLGTMYSGKGTTVTGMWNNSAAAINLNNYQWESGNVDFISNRMRQQT